MNIRSAKPAKAVLVAADGARKQVVRRPLVERYVIDADALSTL
jgi:hypothetical protein